MMGHICKPSARLAESQQNSTYGPNNRPSKQKPGAPLSSSISCGCSAKHSGLDPSVQAGSSSLMRNGHLQRRSPMLLRICPVIHLPIQPPNDLPVQPSISPPIQPPIRSPLGQTLPPYLLSEGESRIVSQMWRLRGVLCPASPRGEGTVLPLFKEGLWHLEQMMVGQNCCCHIFIRHGAPTFTCSNHA